MPIKLDGMSEVTKTMEALKRALDGVLNGLSFDPQKPEEVEQAIREIENSLEQHCFDYSA